MSKFRSRFRDPRTGQYREMEATGQQALGMLMSRMWVPTNPNETITINTQRDGRNVPTAVRMGENGSNVIAEVRRLGLRTFAYNAESLEAERRLQREDRRREFYRARQGMSFAAEAIDTFTMGAGSALNRLSGGDPGAVFQNIRQYNPQTSLAGQIFGMSAGLLTSAAGAPGGAAGLGNVAGNAARAAVGSRVAPTALGGLGRMAPGVADIAADTVVSTGGMALQNLAQGQDPSQVAENLLSDGALSFALGMGLEGAGGIVSRAWRAGAESTPGRRVVTTLAREADDQAQQLRTMQPDQLVDLAHARLQDELFSGGGPNMMGPFARTLGRGTSMPDEVREVLATPGGRAMFRRAENTLDTELDKMVATTRLVQDLEGESARMGQRLSQRYDELLRSIDAGDSMRWHSLQAPLLLDEVSDLTRALRQRPGHGTDAAASAIENAVSKVRRNLQNNSSARSTFEEMLELRRAIDNSPRLPAVMESGGLSGVERNYVNTAAARIREFTTNEEIWGELGKAQGRVDAAFRPFLESLNDNPTIAGLFRDTKQTFKQKLDALFRQSATSAGEDALDNLNDFYVRSRNVASTMRELFGESDSTKALEQLASQAVVDGETTRYLYRVRRLVREQLGRENQGTGFASNLGVHATGLATMGGIFGGPIGAVIGGLAGLGYTSLFRPAAFANTIGAMEEVAQKIGMRRANALQTFQTNLNTGKLTRPATGTLSRAVPMVVLNHERSQEELAQEYEQVSRHIENLSANPEALMASITSAVAPLELVDYQAAQMMSQSLVTAQQHLMATMPPKVVDPLMPNRDVSPPSKTEMNTWISRFRMVEDPWSMLERFAEGTLTQEEADTVKIVYPGIYGSAVSDVAGVLSDYASQGKDLPYQVRVHVGNLLGIETDPTLSSGFLGAMMNQGAQTVQQNAAIRGNSGTTRPARSVQMSVSMGDRLSSDN